MNKFTLFWCFLHVLNAIDAVSIDYSDAKEWNSFKTEFSKSYSSKAEEEDRFEVFMENKRLIDRHNEKFHKGEVTYEMGLNKFSDLRYNEFIKLLKLHMPRSKHLKAKNNDMSFYKAPSGFTAPPNVDWNAAGAVTGVKDQEDCGSCWAFSTTGALEGQQFIKKKELISLSEQNLIDCSTDYGNEGCDGGLMEYAFDYVKDHGIATTDSYPYEAEDEKCRHDRENTSSIIITGYQNIRKGDEEALKDAVATIGPISVAISVIKSFMEYKQGIYYEPECIPEELNHGVLVVGYGTENGTDYWLVKNSWGRLWGIDGYIKMARNKDNNCGIASDANYPLLVV